MIKSSKAPISIHLKPPLFAPTPLLSCSSASSMAHSLTALVALARIASVPSCLTSSTHLTSSSCLHLLDVQELPADYQAGCSDGNNRPMDYLGWIDAD